LGFSRFFSFSTLLLGAFLVVLFPLLGGILNISYQLDRIVVDGRHSVEITEEVTLLCPSFVFPSLPMDSSHK
jgi:hypothetical protein